MQAASIDTWKSPLLWVPPSARAFRSWGRHVFQREEQRDPLRPPRDPRGSAFGVAQVPSSERFSYEARPGAKWALQRCREHPVGSNAAPGANHSWTGGPR